MPTQRQTGPVAQTFRAPSALVDDFLPRDLAAGMRSDIDAHFADPAAHGPETHQLWNYWFVPDLYTYLRTRPEKIVRMNLVEAFMAALRTWSLNNLGFGGVTWPNLSLYVPGCRQAWHNDAGNGRFGFVYSLTRDARRTIGGETLIQRGGDAFRMYAARPAAGTDLHDRVEPRFNRLVIFDDRLPHAVEQVAGSMDPVEGRFVLHGHLSEAGPAVQGALSPGEVAEPVAGILRDFTGEAAARIALYHGPLSLRFVVDQSGSVTACDVMLDRVIHMDGGHADWDVLLALIIERFKSARFPRKPGETVVIQSITFGPALKR